MILRDKDKDIPEPNKWHLPGGGTEPDETPEETARRELKEETNLEPKIFRYVLDFDGLDYLYHAPLEDSEIKNIKLGDEGQRLSFFTFQEVKMLDLTKGLKAALNEPEYHEMVENFLKQ